MRAENLTPDSSVEVHRLVGTVVVDGRTVANFGQYYFRTREESQRMENYADTLWTHIQDLQAAREGWPV